MRQTAIVGTAVVLTAIVTIWGSNVISGSVAKQSIAAPASPSINVMQMMKEAKDLPVQQYDAH
jgi:hypothetical protein